MAQFGPALQLPWTYLPAPQLTDKLIDDVVDGTSQQLGERSIAALERYRDDTLLAVLEAVKPAKHSTAWPLAIEEHTMPALITYRTPVQQDWVDYNGHLRDAFTC